MAVVIAKMELKNEILGPEDTIKHATELAKGHITGKSIKFPNGLVNQLDRNYRQIFNVYITLNRETEESSSVSSAAEWLLDNIYIIEEQVKEIKQILSKRYCFRLPVLKNGEFKGYPRVYVLALDLVAHTDGIINEKSIINFLKAYQSQQPLLMSELWALAIMFRMALIERISKLCEELKVYNQQRNEAKRIAALILDNLGKGASNVQELIEKQVGEKPEISPSFLEVLIQTLRKDGQAAAEAIGYIDQVLKARGLSLENLINTEHQLQATRQVAIGNAITGLRSIAAIDWNEPFETLSHVEEILRQDPSGHYSLMDFESRDHYRHIVEKISRIYNISEFKVAQKALSYAKDSPVEIGDPMQHIGYYLINTGRGILERGLNVRAGGTKVSLEFFKQFPQFFYFSLITLVTLAILVPFLGYSVTQGVYSPLSLFLIALVLLIPISEISINIINFISSHLYSPALMPKLELKDGISEENNTMVIIPTLLPEANRVTELLEKLEIYYLANKEENLSFALVGDFKDSTSPETGNETEIIDSALEGIAKLNQRYSRDKTIFYYFHRKRQYNDAHKLWMGWERKRGAIVEFNDLLRGSKDTSFNVSSCEPAQVPSVKYVITLDADTKLPIGAAKRLIGAMAHPLNKPVIDSKRGITVRGYGILQPRIGISLDSANKTLFSRIFAGQGGIDPYTTAVSDVYQDLFGEGIFTGKGIYDVDNFQTLLKNVLPENSVLSHDLLEGSYVRAGLVTDIELIDGYPARYNSFSMRQHRWVRGDWQLIPWLTVSPLSTLSKWKIFDNLRRSLVNPALFLLIALGFFMLPGHSLIWLGLAVITLAFPIIAFLCHGILDKTNRLIESNNDQTVITGIKSSVYQTALQFIFIPYQAYLMLDAILRTLIRVFISRKNLLEWTPAADLEAMLKNDLPTYFKNMIISPILGILILGLAIIKPGTIVEVLFAVLVWALWTSSPFIAYRLSQDYEQEMERLVEAEELELRKLARKTWAYFEDFVSVKDNYLPPDNYQVDPPNGIAHRTSPTNIGLSLVCTLAARDFGYLGTGEMIEKLSATITTIEKLEKWEGHLYNWYDTKNLQTLAPRFVSTVDSGNFISYLMVLEKGVEEYLNGSTEDSAIAKGLMDTIALFNEELSQVEVGLDTKILEEYLVAGNHQIWEKALENLKLQLAKDELKERVKRSFWGKKLVAMVEEFEHQSKVTGESILKQGEELLTRIRFLIDNTKFLPLFDSKRQLFSIGYNGDEGLLIKSYYDLLASEARIASYIAIARGEVAKKHWFRLGRKLTRVDNHKGLVSWTGTMFEYLMPLLVMRNFRESLLDETYSFVVQTQKKYGQQRAVPWGISESGYHAFDVALNYQYKAFGVPQIGFKRGLGNELVVAPYATVMALMINPKGAFENILRLKEAGMDGDYGLYEAIDYTPVRTALHGESAIVKSYMVHHQGMSMLAFSNLFNENIMQRRFHANPFIRSAEELLQERVPSKVSIVKEHKEEFKPVRRKVEDKPGLIRQYEFPNGQQPNVQLLSNGSYSVMVTDSGSGYSRNKDLAVARWLEKPGDNNLGFFIYVQNINSNNVWSATYEPYNIKPEAYKVVFSPDKAEFIRTDGNIETHTQIVVSPEDNAEIRTVTLTNHSQHNRTVEVTSYLEVVLTHPEADLAHPAFSNLFVTTEFVPQYHCLLATRRPRSAENKPLYALHTINVEGEVIGDLQYETDRAKFIGRNRGLANPLAMDVDQPLSSSVGAVLDPVLSLRRRVKIEPGHSIRISYTLAMTNNRDEALSLADKYRDPKVMDRAFELAWNRSRIESGYLDIKTEDMDVYSRMVTSILFPGPGRLKYKETIEKNKKGQIGLWPFGISGDLPLVLVHINNKEQVDLVSNLLKAHEFWQMKGLKVDLVFLAEDEGGYVQPLQDSIREAISASHARDLMNQRGGVFLLNANIMEADEKNLIYAVARIILRGENGSIKEQLKWEEAEFAVPMLKTADNHPVVNEAMKVSGVSKVDPSQLTFFNGIGGFSADGKEYLIHLREEMHTPAPWINVIANHSFGFNVSEVGSGYTWAENSRENKLTPWYNDPVTDPLGEVFYLRDEQVGDFWSITPMPVREKEEYVIRHGQGYTTFEHTSHGIEQQLTQFVAIEDPVKFSLIKLKNLSEVPKELSLTYYMRPVLGVNEKVSAPYITSESSGEKGILLITNSYNSDFPGRVVFVDTSEVVRTFTGDNQEFIGNQGSLNSPSAMKREKLSNKVGPGLTPCGAIQIKVTLVANETKDMVFLLGQGSCLSEAISLATKYRAVATVQAELATVKAFWHKKLGAIQVRTPDKSMDLLLNGWLQYQVVSCRLWSRAAFYQSGGAYGFRDQLQDVMATVYTWPELTRKQILLHSAHQFIEGDVQHWWHPGADKGIRTRYSDDLLWLPYVTADYIEATADWSVLEEVVGFLEDELLPHDEDEKYSVPRTSDKKDTVYVHCIKAIEKALKFGVHGLPLMGSGDWNDGMNKVGNLGKGESVWLAWFLYKVLQRFIPICKARSDDELVEKYSSLANNIAEAIEKNAWDGSWYRRAYFDDGTALGSAGNLECKIDAIAQSWSVISGIGKPQRAEEAMKALENYLIDREAGIIKLLTPPFGDGDLQPGYIKGYVPGVRENGGQYTHAAVWTIMAFAMLGYGNKACEYFSLVNPVNHALTTMDAMRYKVEPYVLAADVYAVSPNTGRGGWSWYTGAAGWMYRVGLEHILGLKKVGNQLHFNPCIPKEWQDFQMEYHFLNTIYRINVKNPGRVSKGVKETVLDEEIVSKDYISLVDDGKEHIVEVIMG